MIRKLLSICFLIILLTTALRDALKECCFRTCSSNSLCTLSMALWLPRRCHRWAECQTAVWGAEEAMWAQKFTTLDIYWINTLFLVALTIKYVAPGGEKSISEFINVYPGVKKWCFICLNFHTISFPII